MGKIDLVFYSESFTPLDGNNIRRALTIALNLAKIQDLHFHDLRYTFATWAAVTFSCAHVDAQALPS